MRRMQSEHLLQAAEYQIAVYPVVLPGAVPGSVVGGGYADTTEDYLGFVNVCQALGLMTDEFYVDEGGFSAKITSETEKDALI